MSGITNSIPNDIPERKSVCLALLSIHDEISHGSFDYNKKRSEIIDIVNSKLDKYEGEDWYNNLFNSFL